MGYTYLTGVYEVEGSFDAAIRLAEEAERQGWAGDWDKRIVRCRRKATGEIPSGLGEDPFRLPPQSRGALGSPAT